MFNKKSVAAATALVAISLVGSSVAYADVAAPQSGTNVAGPMGGQNRIATVLSQLVTQGTITQAQADAITAAFKAAAPVKPTPNASGQPQAGGMGRGGMGRGGFGGFGMNTAAREAIITSTLGITAADLQTARQAGKSLATLAGANTAALITALVNYDSTQIDAAVTAGKLTSAQATQMKSNLTQRVTDEVNNVRGPRPGMSGFPKASGTSITKTVTRTVYKH
jgi:polyhydroxyalkanoate synthesis regulator phasin